MVKKGEHNKQFLSRSFCLLTRPKGNTSSKATQEIILALPPSPPKIIQKLFKWAVFFLLKLQPTNQLVGSSLRSTYLRTYICLFIYALYLSKCAQLCEHIRFLTHAYVKKKTLLDGSFSLFFFIFFA